MLSIAVCDDNLLDCCTLSINIKNILEEMKIPFIIHRFNNGSELLNSIEHFDIIFLDIIMKNVDGMETAHILRNNTFDKILIFISASREYVFDAYDVEAFQYLLKPIDMTKLKNVIIKAVKKSKQDNKEFIVINNDRQIKKLFLQEIYYFKITGRIIYVYCTNGSFHYYERLTTLENLLKGKGFFRCHKSYLINLHYVHTYNKHEVILDNQEKIPISKRRYEAFSKEILSFMKKGGCL